MSLRLGFQLLTLGLFVVAAVPVWFAVHAMAEGIVEQWAVRYAEKQVLYDKSRMLQPILREVALSRQLADSAVLIDWAGDPDNPDKTRDALEELERFRVNFQDQNYFVGLLSNGRYYHNNRTNDYIVEPLRYVLDPAHSKDAWFYDLINQGRDVHINVNPDPELGLTKLWIDVLLRDQSGVLGVVGTGLDLSDFTVKVVDLNAPGITSLIVNHMGAIQVHRNHALIDFGSISKKGGEANTIDLIFIERKDRQFIQAAMAQLKQAPDQVITGFVQIDGRRHMAGVAYLPEIDWYEITLLDLDVLLPLSQFSGIVIVYVLTLLFILFAFSFLIDRFVVLPLVRLNDAVSAVAAGRTVPHDLRHRGAGEMRNLLQHFTDMAEKVAESRHDLELKIQERTLALQRLTRIDPLTELLNRRGMTERMHEELGWAQRHGVRVGILWLDVDHFKEINDQQGHSAGDDVLKCVAAAIQHELRTYDLASRWGGDEFLVMVSPADPDMLEALAGRIARSLHVSSDNLTARGLPVVLRVSIGGCLSSPQESLDNLLQRGDQALYAAKAAGRNCYRLHV